MTALLETRGVWQRFGGLIILISLARPQGLIGLFSRTKKAPAS